MQNENFKIPQKKIAKPIEIANFIYENLQKKILLFLTRFCLFQVVNKSNDKS